MNRFRVLMTVTAVFLFGTSDGRAQGTSDAAVQEGAKRTRTPIEHLIVVIGENHTFDNLFGGYQPPEGQTVSNLLSKSIINADGTPGPNFSAAVQYRADDLLIYSIDPVKSGPYATLPQPNTTEAFGEPFFGPDRRFPANLPNGPFQITKYVPFDAYTGDPVHRFFQMWQEFDLGRLDLFPWVALTTGLGPQNFPPPTPVDTYQGGEAMGFYNMSTGDAAHFKAWAQAYSISDNYHQGIMGGTGANFFYLATGDVPFYTENGAPGLPPSNQIEDPNPVFGTKNFYTRDGYEGGSYVNCADPRQPGVASIQIYLRTLPYVPFRKGNCEPDHYYLVNNYNPGYTPSGEPMPLGPNFFTVPPQTVPTLAEALSAKGISWKWYSGGRNNGKPSLQYCSICDPFTFSTGVMTSALKDNLQGIFQFYQDVAGSGSLPEVSFVRPFESLAGHPADSTPAAYERFVADLISRVQANPGLWASCAILITTDEGGGYYDSGFIQTLDFFGDGPRIPLIAVSPFAKPGHIDHTYADHASILKFIELNWGLAPLSGRSRDNLPNPIVLRGNRYVPANRPAIGDLTSLFNFPAGSD